MLQAAGCGDSVPEGEGGGRPAAGAAQTGGFLSPLLSTERVSAVNPRVSEALRRGPILKSLHNSMFLTFLRF